MSGKKLNILVLSNRLPYPLNDGGNIATYKNIEYFNKIGYKVSLFSLNTKKHWHSPDPLEKICQVYAFDIETGLQVSTVFKYGFNFNKFALGRFYSAEIEHSLAQLLAKESFDIIQLEGPYMWVYKKALQKKGKAKVVLRAHNIEHLIWQRQAKNEKRFFKRLLAKKYAQNLKQLEYELLPNLDGVIAISDEDEAYFKQMGFKGLLSSINAGIELGAICETLKPTPNTIGFIGSLEWLPNVMGLEWFVKEVWDKVLELHPKAELHVAGKNPIERVKAINAKNYVFYGMVDSAKVFTQQNELMIVPLLSGSGMRMKIIEAMANKKCVVSTSIGAEGIQLENKKDAWIEDNPQKMAEAIAFLLKNKAKNAEIAENGYGFVQKNYDWNELILNFANFYETV